MYSATLIRRGRGYRGCVGWAARVACGRGDERGHLAAPEWREEAERRRRGEGMGEV